MPIHCAYLSILAIITSRSNLNVLGPSSSALSIWAVVIVSSLTFIMDERSLINYRSLQQRDLTEVGGTIKVLSNGHVRVLRS